jgi:hypothetical protein
MDGSRLLELSGSLVVVAPADSRDIYEPTYHLGGTGRIVKHGGMSTSRRQAFKQRIKPVGGALLFGNVRNRRNGDIDSRLVVEGVAHSLIVRCADGSGERGG